jgi:hypothetical protein
MTVIYEVNLNVDRDIEGEFGRWLSLHVEQMLALPGFVGADIASEEREPGQTAGWSVRYRLLSRQALDAYFRDHAERMRADGIDRFGQRFSASRRILLPAADD